MFIELLTNRLLPPKSSLKSVFRKDRKKLLRSFATGYRVDWWRQDLFQQLRVSQSLKLTSNYAAFMKTTQAQIYTLSLLKLRRSFWATASAVALFVLSFAGICAADTSFGTGPAWQISLNNGASYGPPDAFSTRTLPDGSTATGIEGGNPFNVADRYYRFTFTLTELTMSATTQFVTNTLFGLLVNGNSVDLTLVMNSGPNTNNFSPVTGLAIPGSYFQLGSNQIIFQTHSLTGGSAGDPFLGARVDIRAVPEPSTWAMMLAGGGMLFAIQRIRGGRSV